MRPCILAASLLIFLTLLPLAIAAPNYAIPINGRFHSRIIELQIPPTPSWAHDTVVNASQAWNKAQLWFRQFSLLDDTFNFTESKTGEVSVHFRMPSPYNDFAVGWTEYSFDSTAPGIISSAQVFLDGAVFNSTQESNATARHYAFWIALHELGRVLGLGSVLDGRDIMDPRATYRNADQPLLSTLDLYAVQFLASNLILASFVSLPNTIEYKLVNA